MESALMQFSLPISAEYNGYSFTDEIIVDVQARPTLQLASDTTVCDNESFVTTPLQVSNGTLIWSDGSVGSCLEINKPGFSQTSRLYLADWFKPIALS